MGVLSVLRPVCGRVLKLLLTKRRYQVTALLAAMATAAAVKYLREATRRLAMQRELASTRGASHAALALQTSRSALNSAVRIDSVFLRRLLFVLRVAMPSPFCRESANALALTVSLLARTAMTLTLSRNMGSNVEALCNRDWRRVMNLSLEFVSVTTVAALLNALIKYFSSTLAINLRDKVSVWDLVLLLLCCVFS